MESRQVTLLKRGYYSGRLTFEYPQPLSHLREAIILSDIEREEYQRVFATRSLIDAVMAGASGNRKAFELPYETLKQYTKLALPYYTEKGKMDKSISKDEIAQWKALREEILKAK